MKAFTKSVTWNIERKSQKVYDVKKQVELIRAGRYPYDVSAVSGMVIARALITEPDFLTIWCVDTGIIHLLKTK